MTKFALWSSLDKILFQLINLGISILIARHIGPNQLATVAIITGYVYFLNIFVDSGLTISIIRNKNITSKEISSIFYFNMFVSIIFIILTLLSSKLIENYLKITNLSFYLNLSSFILLFNSFTFVRYAIMEQKMEFRLLSFINLSSILISSTICVIMLYNGNGIISVVLFNIITAFIRNVLYLIFTPKFKNDGFDYQVLKPHLIFGKNLLFSSSIEAIYNNGFPIILTKLFSAYHAGIFYQSKKLIDGPILLLSSSSRRLFLPIASNYENDLDKTFDLLVRLLKFISYIVVFLLGIIFINSSYLISNLLGESWGDSVIVLKTLIFGMIFYPAFFLCIDVYKIQGDSLSYSKMIMNSRIISTLLMIISSYLGFLYLVSFFSIAQFFMFIYAAFSLKKKYNYSFNSLINCIVPFVFVMIAILLVSKLINFSNQKLTLIISNINFVFCYIILCRYIIKYNPLKFINK